MAERSVAIGFPDIVAPAPPEYTGKRWVGAKSPEWFLQWDVPTSHSDFLTSLVKSHARHNLYFTPAVFTNRKDGRRTKEFAHSVSCLWVDIDGVATAKSGGEAWAHLADALDWARLPQPNAVVCTSSPTPQTPHWRPRLQAYWRIPHIRLSPRGLHLWRSLSLALAQRVAQLGFTVDVGASTNVVGFVRLPGSYHTTTGSTAFIVGERHDLIHEIDLWWECLEMSSKVQVKSYKFVSSNLQLATCNLQLSEGRRQKPELRAVKPRKATQSHSPAKHTPQGTQIYPPTARRQKNAPHRPAKATQSHPLAKRARQGTPIYPPAAERQKTPLRALDHPQLVVLARGVPCGLRNTALYALAKALWADGLPLPQAHHWALAWNSRCEQPESTRKVLDVVSRAYGAYGPQRNPERFTWICPAIVAAAATAASSRKFLPDHTILSLFPATTHHPRPKKRSKPAWLRIGDAILKSKILKTHTTITLETLAQATNSPLRTVQRYSHLLRSYIAAHARIALIRTAAGFIVARTKSALPIEEPPQESLNSGGGQGSGGMVRGSWQPEDSRSPPAA